MHVLVQLNESFQRRTARAATEELSFPLQTHDLFLVDRAASKMSFAVGPTLLKLRILAQLIDSFPPAYASRSAAAKKLCCSLYTRILCRGICIENDPSVSRDFPVTSNPAKTTYFSSINGCFQRHTARGAISKKCCRSVHHIRMLYACRSSRINHCPFERFFFCLTSYPAEAAYFSSNNRRRTSRGSGSNTKIVVPSTRQC